MIRKPHFIYRFLLYFNLLLKQTHKKLPKAVRPSDIDESMYKNTFGSKVAKKLM